MKLNLLAGAAVAAVVAASAPLAANAQTTGTDWTGFYAGINLGGAWSTTCATWTPTLGSVDAVFTGNNCPNNASFIGGGQIGYNYQTSNFVIGLEGDIGGATSTSSSYSRTTVGV